MTLAVEKLEGMKPEARRVLIVGAGPTGLVLALWLTRLGVRVRIVDRAAEAGTTSRAVAVQARTLELYRQVGLSTAVVDAGVKVAAANLWAGGARVARLPLGQLGKGLSPFPYALTYQQDAHERLLIERLAALGVEVERRTELLRFDLSRLQCVYGEDEDDSLCRAPELAGAEIVKFPGGHHFDEDYEKVADAILQSAQRRERR